MQERDLYQQILGLESPWKVTDVKFHKERSSDTTGNPLLKWQGEVTLRVEHSHAIPLHCPECNGKSPGYDTRPRRWRHLDTCQFKTIVVCDVPRIQCQEHGVHQVKVPWAEDGSRFTALFEALAIDWLKEASHLAVADILGLTWDQIDGICQRAVKRGLLRRQPSRMHHLAVDETSFQKRHEYVTVVTNQDGNRVEFVADGRSKNVLDSFWQRLSANELEAVQTVSMDMWRPYIRSTMDHVPGAEQKICFDKFHVAKHLGGAVDQVRRMEHANLLREGNDRLKGSKYLWLQNPGNMSNRRWQSFAELRASKLKTARAWHMKEVAMSLWDYVHPTWARKAWKKWLGWAARCRLNPMKSAAKMIGKHLQGILNAVVKKVSNAGAESINSKIQKIKSRACGFRNRERFRNAIYFHCGGLDMYPRLGSTHTKS